MNFCVTSITDRRRLITSLGPAAAAILLSGCTNGPQGRGLAAIADSVEQDAAARTTIAVVIGAAIGYGVARRTGNDPTLGILIGAFAGGSIVALAEAYGKHLLHAAGGRTLPSLTQLNDDQSYDIAGQVKLSAGIRAQTQSVKLATADGSRLIANAEKLEAARNQIEGHIRQHNRVYGPSPQVYRAATRFVVERGSRAGGDEPVIPRAVALAAQGTSQLQSAVDTTKDEIIRNAHFLHSKGVFIRLEG